MDKTLQQRVEEVLREEIAIVPYDSRWPVLFDDEARFLRAFLPASIITRIEHFGSTAVPGLAAKPIVDMLIEVASLDETRKQVAPLLEAAGYDYFWRTDVDPPYAWFIKRGSDGRRTHHLHMVEADSNLWDRLCFRDYLREFDDEARRYEELKRSLAAKYPTNREAYTKAKFDFVVAITEKAKEYFNQR
jgi:GrpB-like predicted nucleotidyltransferase (UPF0157 family)